MSTEWVDYVEESMKYQAFLPHFVSMGGWLEGSWGWWMGGWWWGGWCACEGGGWGGVGSGWVADVGDGLGGGVLGVGVGGGDGVVSRWWLGLWWH